jgi:outer membrane beta-barrel protein
MIRRILQLLAVALAIAVIGSGAPAYAQDEDEEMTFDTEESTESKESKDDAKPEPEPPPEDLGALDADLTVEGDGAKPVKATADDKLSDTRVSWQDIVVVVRKPFLKVGRLELLPMWAVTMNDNLIQHYTFGGSVSYHLTDVLSVGVEGQYFVKNLREPFDLVARQARRLPTVNKYNYGGSLNFNYVPIYGKFAVLDENLIHWEAYFTAGVGATQSEVLPRDPALQPFTNLLITPNVGLAMRFFLAKWLTVHVGVRDYIFIDKFEATNRMETNGDDAKANADSALVNNVMFQAGVSLWLPTSFEYTTFR